MRERWWIESRAMDALSERALSIPGWATPRQPGVLAAATALVGGRVLVLNASYEPINVCTTKRATNLLLKAKAEIVELSEQVLHSERFDFARPVVIRLLNYVRIPRDVHRRRITRKAVLARDEWTCQYCGLEEIKLTVDHVIPRSRGGSSAWENIVASCAPCNRRKGNRLPHEIKMHPRKKPGAPGPNVFIRIAAPRVPEAWEPYLGRGMLAPSAAVA